MSCPRAISYQIETTTAPPPPKADDEFVRGFLAAKRASQRLSFDRLAETVRFHSMPPTGRGFLLGWHAYFFALNKHWIDQ